jgi:hypothetical protein
MRRDRRCCRSSSSGWRPADTGGAQEAPDTLEIKGVTGGEGGGGDAVAVGSDQLGDVAFGEAVAQAPGRVAVGPGVRAGPVNATVWQSRKSAAFVECE